MTTANDAARFSASVGRRADDRGGQRARRWCLAFLFFFGSLAGFPTHAQTTYPFDLPAQPLAESLRAVGHQTSTNVMFEPRLVKGLAAPALRAQATMAEAIRLLLTGTKLTALQTAADTILIQGAKDDVQETSGSRTSRQENRSVAVSQAAADVATPRSARLEEVSVEIPEILVTGSKILNMDIPRSRDDAQPYVIFDRRVIERSGAANIEDFLRQRLPMNTLAAPASQSVDTRGNMSQINLRGLGTNQTLILIDGHRTGSANFGGAPGQADLNGIPLSAIERIEVLPTTASGIYGGSATGGVVNVILRRDYSGAELKMSYEDTFAGDSPGRRLDLGSGFALEGGKTQVMLAGSYYENDGLLIRDRDFAERGRAAITTNNPAFFPGGSAPPLGRTTNIRSANGSPLFGPGTPNFTHVPVGHASGGGAAAFLGNAGTYNLALADTAQSTDGEDFALAARPTVRSLTTTIRRDLHPAVHAFLEGSASKNESEISRSLVAPAQTVAANAPNNPFGQALAVNVPLPAAQSQLHSESENRRVVAGVIVKLPGQWRAEADYTWQRSSFSSAFGPTLSAEGRAAISNGTLDVLRDTSRFPLDLTPYLVAGARFSPQKSTLKDVTLRIAGPLASLPAGPVILSVLAERRDEVLGEGFQFVNPTLTQFFPERSQSVDSVYLEAKLPLVSERSGVSGVRGLELQLAGRHDEYTVNGVTGSIIVGSTTPIVRSESTVSSTNPTIGLRYEPMQDLVLRASYGTGFHPPTVNQILANAPATQTGAFVDPRRGNTAASGFSQREGGNPNLRPEESESWSAGFILTPRFAPGARLSVDYTRISKSDNIATLGVQQIIDNEHLLPGRVTRGPVAPGDPFGVGPITAIDRTLVNISSAEIEAYDVSIDHRLATGRFGAFDFFALASWQTRFETQLIPGAPEVENVGITSAFPLRFRANAGLTWEHHNWMIGWSARYFHSYVISTNATTVLNQGSASVPAQTYHDLFATYRFDTSASSFLQSMLRGVEVQLGIKNVFDKEPPFDASSFYYYSPFGDPRLAAYYLTLSKSF